jgi:hypothetical protein
VRWGATRDSEQIRKDFTRWPDANIGIPTGADNGFWVLETDTKTGHANLETDGRASLQALTDRHGPLPPTLQGASPTESDHRYFKNPKGLTIRNSASKLAPGIDVRGEGGMVVAPPSVRDGVGVYRWITNIAPAEAPVWLLQLIQEGTTAEREHEREPNPDLIGPIEMIEAALAVIPNDDAPWESSKGISWNGVGMAVYAASGGSDEGEVLFDKWSQKSKAKYNADNTAKKWEEFYRSPPNRIGFGSLVYWADEADPNWRNRYYEQQATKPGAEPITTPVDLWAQFELPPLPVELLPRTIADFAVEQGELIGADPAGLAVSALTVCAAAIPDPIMLRVKRYGGWLESARLWAAIVGLISMKKTPLMLAAAYPLVKIDTELSCIYAAAKQAWDALPADQRRVTPQPKKVRTRLEDTTIEGAREVLRDSPNGVLCFQDELSGWFGSMDKYSGPRGAANDRAFWLKSYNGGSYVVDRAEKGRSGFIPNLSVSLLGGIHPDTLRKVTADTLDDGLIQRTIPLMLRPASMSHDMEIPAATYAYNALVRALHTMRLGSEHSQFSDAAREIRNELEEKHLELVQYEAVNKKLAAHVGKYDGIFARLCLIWHCIEGCERQETAPAAIIDTDIAKRVAAFLHGFLLPHALAFYTTIYGLADDHDRLTAVAGYILARRLTILTNRDIQRGDRTMRGLNRQDIEGVFHQLDALGWVSRIPGARLNDPPRATVNPEVHRLFAERAKQEAERRQREHEMITKMLRGRGMASDNQEQPA